jgi:hypothetical protein
VAGAGAVVAAEGEFFVAPGAAVEWLTAGVGVERVLAACDDAVVPPVFAWGCTAAAAAGLPGIASA